MCKAENCTYDEIKNEDDSITLKFPKDMNHSIKKTILDYLFEIFYKQMQSKENI